MESCKLKRSLIPVHRYHLFLVFHVKSSLFCSAVYFAIRRSPECRSQRQEYTSYWQILHSWPEGQFQYSVIILSTFFPQTSTDHSLNKTLWWLESNFGLKYIADVMSRARSVLQFHFKKIKINYSFCPQNRTCRTKVMEWCWMFPKVNLSTCSLTHLPILQTKT